MGTPTSIDRIPTSCDDLQTLGNIKSGLYNLMNDTKVSVVYCDFTKQSGDFDKHFSFNIKAIFIFRLISQLCPTDYETYIGYADLKTTTVLFYFQRANSDSSSYSKLPFDMEITNKGNAMDGATGVFTAPVYGYYFFSFTGTINFGLATTGNNKKSYLITLLVDDNIMGFARVDESNTENDQWNSLHLEMTIVMRPGEQLWLRTDSGQGNELIGLSYTHFTGMLVEEDSFTF